MANPSSTVTVHILDKEYLVACPDGEWESLHKSAQYLDSKMRGIRASGKIHGLERIAVMAALNIAHEFLQKDTSSTSSQDIAQRLTSKVDEVLQELS